MDTLRPQILDANKARSIIENTHSRLSKKKKKTSEEYISILLDEVNKYFSQLENVTFSSSDLPNSMAGPDSTSHNFFVNSLVDDIDRIRVKHRVAENLITKAVNFMSSERSGIASTASNTYSRIINKKLRSSVNDKGMVIFSEFFNDYGLTDVKETKNVRIDKSRSVLSLEPQIETKDNSNLIDPASISIGVEFDNSVQSNNIPARVKSIYPLSTQLESKEFKMGYGSSLSKEEVFSLNSNTMNAGPGNSSDLRHQLIQKTTLKKGFIGDQSAEGDNGEDTFGEFELIWTDFRASQLTNNLPGAMDAVRKSITDAGFSNSSISVNPQNIIIDHATGSSFSGSNDNDGSETNYEETDIPINKIKNLILTFKLKDGVNLPGNLSKVSLSFVKPEVGGIIPTLDPVHSVIITSDGEFVRPFIKSMDSIQNPITEERSLALSSAVTRPKQFRIVFNLSDTIQSWKEIKTYLGAFWFFRSKGNQPITDTSAFIVTNVGRIYFVYHDLVRGEGNAPDKLRELNLPVAKKVVSTLKDISIA